VNPLLAAICVWLIYRLLAKIRNPRTGVFGAFLLSISPFFLILSSTLLSHTFSLFLSMVFFLSWFDSQSDKSTIPVWISNLTCGLSMGLLALSRPLTALGVFFPFFIYSIIIVLGKNNRKKKNILITGLIIGLYIPLYFLWQYILTGDPMRNPYTFVWPYDTIGFGPGIGRQPGGYLPSMAIKNARASLYVGMFDLFGWLKYSWLFLPVGLIPLILNRRAWLVIPTLITVVAAYTLYWIGSDLFGPRYYFEALPACILLTAAAFDFLMGMLPELTGFPFWKSISTWRTIFAGIIFSLLIISPVLFYLPVRLPRFHNLYGSSAERLKPFLQANKPGITPALVIVHITQSWTDYSSLTELSNPYFDTPLVFSLYKGKEMDAVAASMFPGRFIWHYYPDEINILRNKEK
jgi:4-amino-4-deoxy-L-arabinose transferase-like glycosyltransferase